VIPRWLDRLLDDDARAALAARIDRPIGAAFTIVRNAGFVAVAQYIAARADTPAFTAIYLVLAAMLMAQIASQFMLRPQLRLIPGPHGPRTRLLNGALNMALCAAACALALLAIDRLVDGMIAFQIANPNRTP